MFRFDLSLSATQLLVVDVQERLLPHIADQARVLAQVERMMHAAAALGLPTTLCEQYPQGLGPSATAVAKAAGGAPILHKLTFSAARDAAIAQRLIDSRRSTVLLVGIETHVCVQQTAWDLLDLGLRPVVLADAVGSRRTIDHETALAGMRAGRILVTTVEAALFRLLDRCDTDAFKRILPLVK